MASSRSAPTASCNTRQDVRRLGRAWRVDACTLLNGAWIQPLRHPAIDAPTLNRAY